MNSFINFFLESNLYLICFYLLYQIFLARDKHFRFNRAFLLGGVILSLILPMLSFNISPAATQTADSFEGYIILPAITITTAQTESIGFIIKWWQIIGIVYLAGILFFFSRLFWQITQILRHLPLLNSSRNRNKEYTLVTTNGEIPTCSFFKYLLWDNSVNLNEDEKQQIVTHELVHIRQWHSLDILFFELLRIIFWINPAVHLLKSRITEVHEFLADHYATQKTGVEKYSRLLTMQIFKSYDFALSNNFHKSQVVKRIRMLRTDKSKSIWLNVALLIPILALLISVLSCHVTEEILPEYIIERNRPELPKGWNYTEAQNTPRNVLKSFEEYTSNYPQGEFIIVKSNSPDRSSVEILNSLENSNWHGVYYNKGESFDYIFIIYADKKVEEITFNNLPTQTSEVFTKVENQPSPIGGMVKFYEYVQSNLQYPVEAKTAGTQGKVFVQFVVNPEGKLVDVQSVKGIGGGCDEEAIRVIKESPLWNAGIEKGKKVNVRMILPITFKLE